MANAYHTRRTPKVCHSLPAQHVSKAVFIMTSIDAFRSIHVSQHVCYTISLPAVVVKVYCNLSRKIRHAQSKNCVIYATTAMPNLNTLASFILLVSIVTPNRACIDCRNAETLIQPTEITSLRRLCQCA